MLRDPRYVDLPDHVQLIAVLVILADHVVLAVLDLKELCRDACGWIVEAIFREFPPRLLALKILLITSVLIKTVRIINVEGIERVEVYILRVVVSIAVRGVVGGLIRVHVGVEENSPFSLLKVLVFGVIPLKPSGAWNYVHLIPALDPNKIVDVAVETEYGVGLEAHYVPSRILIYPRVMLAILDQILLIRHRMH